MGLNLIDNITYKFFYNFISYFNFNEFFYKIQKGDREVKAGSSTETKTFNRELTVPDYVDLEKMNAFLLDRDANRQDKCFLILEAPIILEKYSYRRSAFDKSSMNSQTQSPTRVSRSGFVNSPVHQTQNYHQHHHQPSRTIIPGIYT